MVLSLGKVSLFAGNDGSPFVSIDCQENIGSYDPNDRQAFPRGCEYDHFIEKTTNLECQQNKILLILSIFC